MRNYFFGSLALFAKQTVPLFNYNEFRPLLDITVTYFVTRFEFQMKLSVTKL
jgi:hypothetical protein